MNFFLVLIMITLNQKFKYLGSKSEFQKQNLKLFKTYPKENK